MQHPELTPETVEHLKAVGFYGLDVNLETSLIDHRFIARKTNDPEEIQVIYYYPIDKEIMFGQTSFTNADLNEAFEGMKDAILSQYEMSEEDWKEEPPLNKLADIESQTAYFDIVSPCMTAEDLLTFPALAEA
jgi:hypothetical protein